MRCWALLTRPTVYYDECDLRPIRPSIDNFHSYWPNFLTAGYWHRMKNEPNDFLLHFQLARWPLLKERRCRSLCFNINNFKKKHKHRLRDRSLASWCHNFYPSEERGRTVTKKTWWWNIQPNSDAIAGTLDLANRPWNELSRFVLMKWRFPQSRAGRCSIFLRPTPFVVQQSSPRRCIGTARPMTAGRNKGGHGFSWALSF
jgi:hypothetical protein